MNSLTLISLEVKQSNWNTKKTTIKLESQYTRTRRSQDKEEEEIVAFALVVFEISQNQFRLIINYIYLNPYHQ